METNSPSKVKSALNFGALIGLVLAIFSLITYVFEMYEAQWFGYLSWVALIIGIIVGTKKYRDEQLGGFISYGQSLGYGVLLAFFAAIVSSFVSYIYLGFIDDSFLTFSLEKAEMGMYEGGTPDEQIETAMSYTRKIMTPGVTAIFGLLATTFLGFIISLISSAFIKREADNFDEI